MAFTFDTSLATDIAKVRFHIGDTTEEGAYLTDETITALVALGGSVGGGVILGIRYIITQLSQPDFNLDWMGVKNNAAREGYEKMLKDKEQEFGIYNVVGAQSITPVHRADSYENDDGEYTAPDGLP